MWPSLFGWPRSLGTLSVIVRTCRLMAYFPKCACGETQVKSFFTKKLTTFASVERSLVAKVKMGSVTSVRAADCAPSKPHPRRVSVFLFCVGPALPVPQLLEHETKAKCDKAKAAPASTSGTLGPSTTGHAPGLAIDVACTVAWLEI